MAATSPVQVASSSFEWLCAYSEVRGRVRSALGGACAARACVPGCGSSALSRALVEDGVAAQVLSLDANGECVARLAQENADEPRLQWSTCDVTDGAALRAAVGERPCRMWVDKGTLDALLCEDKHAGYLVALHDELARAGAGAALLVVSLHTSRLLRPLLEPLFPCCELQQCEDFVCGENAAAVLRGWAVLRRRAAHACAGDCGDLRRVHALCRAALERFHTLDEPLLDARREALLRVAWRGRPSLPLRHAYEAMFDDTERDEYLFDAFLEDARAQPRAQEHALTLDDALAFLRANQ
jgi:hypothetical protein